MRKRGKALAVLTLRYRDDHGGTARGGNGFGIFRGHTVVGDHKHAAVKLQQLSHARKSAALDHNIITVFSKIHGKCHVVTSEGMD